MTRRGRLILASLIALLGLVGVWASNRYNSDFVAYFSMSLVFGSALILLK